MGEIQSCVESKLCHRKQTKRAVVTDDIKWGGGMFKHHQDGGPVHSGVTGFGHDPILAGQMHMEMDTTLLVEWASRDRKWG